MDKGHIIHVSCHMGQEGRHHFPTLPSRLEGPGTLHQVAVLPLKTDECFLPRQGRSVILFKSRLMLPQVHVRHGARTEDLNHTARLRGEMRQTPSFSHFQTRRLSPQGSSRTEQLKLDEKIFVWPGFGMHVLINEL